MPVQEINLDRWNAAAPLLTRADVLAIVPVNASTLWRWVRASRFPEPIQAMGKQFWRREALERWMNGEN